jgi:F0F1-type ATP synthase gamma subunit
MNMADPIIEMKGSLKKIQLEHMMIKKIRDELTGNIDNLHDVKMNVDLIRQICCAIENSLNGEKVDKLELFFKIHKSCFGQLDEMEVQTLTNIIKYLNDNNKIKARSLVSKLWRFLRGILLKK